METVRPSMAAWQCGSAALPTQFTHAPMSSRTPPLWPSSVAYITAPRYHSSVPPATRALLTHGATTSPPPPTTSQHVRIRLITDARHPACGQRGLFAHKKIPPRSHIIDYIGQVHCQERPDSDYDLSLYRTHGADVGVDARDMGNESRFINDYRGVADRPNAEFVEYRTVRGELRMGIWSRGEIRRGDEIVVSYGKPWWRGRSGECT